jgi:hypothetical protein
LYFADVDLHALNGSERNKKMKRMKGKRKIIYPNNINRYVIILEKEFSMK